MKKDRDIARFYHLLSTGSRVRIAQAVLSLGKPTVTEIAKKAKLSHSATSHQIGLFRRAKVLVCEKNGREAHYMFGTTPEALSVKFSLTK